MCQRHWMMIPPPLRAAITATYRPGQEVDKDASSEYLAIAHAAIDAVAHKEARLASRKAPVAATDVVAQKDSRGSPRRAAAPKPVQLALFELDSV